MSKRKIHKGIVDGICIALCLLSLCTCVFLFYFHKCDIANIYYAMTHDSDELLSQKNDISRLNGKRNLVSFAMLTNGVKSPDSIPVSICLDSSGREVYDTAMPLLDKYGFVGSFVVRRDSMPGSSGCITPNEARELTSHGWSTLLGGDGGADLTSPSSAQTFGRYIDSCLADCRALGIDLPIGYLLETPLAADECLAELSERGFVTVVQNLPDSNQIWQYMSGFSQKLLMCGSCSLHTDDSTIQLQIYTAATVGGAITVVTRHVTDDRDANGRLDCTTEKFTRALEWYYNYGNTYNFRIVGQQEMVETKKAIYIESISSFGDLDSLTEAYDNLTEEIREKQHELYLELSARYAPYIDYYSLSDFIAFHKELGLKGVMTQISLANDEIELVRKKERSIYWFEDGVRHLVE